MIHFNTDNLEEFLNNYWQKKPVVIRNALPDFKNPLSAEELAGLALEEDVESRLIWESLEDSPQWRIKYGPFEESELTSLPASNWTLLVQGVDKLIPEVAEALRFFRGIPSWRIDDIMISLAALSGSVGPHYDDYDVFLYQAQGVRKWSLTTKKCTPENAVDDSVLRIMKTFETEQEFTLNEGDMLYLPANVGHHGVSESAQCITYSFGYRSYKALELWESFGDFASQAGALTNLYQDPNWNCVKNTNEIPLSAIQSTQNLMHDAIKQSPLTTNWYGCFVTRLDEQAERLLPLALEQVHTKDFMAQLVDGKMAVKESLCRFAYFQEEERVTLFINGCNWPCAPVSLALIISIANEPELSVKSIKSLCKNSHDWQFLFELWQLQWLRIL